MAVPATPEKVCTRPENGYV